MSKGTNYKGVRPAEIVAVLEGDGTQENPYRQTDYVLEHVVVDGFTRMITAGKIVPLTEEERRFFTR